MVATIRAVLVKRVNRDRPQIEMSGLETGNRRGAESYESAALPVP